MSVLCSFAISFAQLQRSLDRVSHEELQLIYGYKSAKTAVDLIMQLALFVFKSINFSSKGILFFGVVVTKTILTRSYVPISKKVSIMLRSSLSAAILYTFTDPRRPVDEGSYRISSAYAHAA